MKRQNMLPNAMAGAAATLDDPKTVVAMDEEEGPDGARLVRIACLDGTIVNIGKGQNCVCITAPSGKIILMA